MQTGLKNSELIKFEAIDANTLFPRLTRIGRLSITDMTAANITVTFCTPQRHTVTSFWTDSPQFLWQCCHLMVKLWHCIYLVRNAERFSEIWFWYFSFYWFHFLWALIGLYFFRHWKKNTQTHTHILLLASAWMSPQTNSSILLKIQSTPSLSHPPTKFAWNPSRVFFALSFRLTYR